MPKTCWSKILYYFCSADSEPAKSKIVRVTILQTDVEWASPAVNRAKALQLIAETQHADLYVLPEMWTTGFITDPDLMARLCEDMVEHSCHSLEWMMDLSARLGSAVSGSIAVKDEQELYRNRLFFVLPSGDYYFYDKHHLFTYSGEDQRYTRGNSRTVVSYGGFRWLLATCYDLRFPVWLRNNDDYDALLLVANWPKSRQEVWSTLLKARALENQCFVIGANRTGNEYFGGSTIIDSKGAILAQATTSEPQTITANLDLASQNQFREKFAVLKNRDGYCLTTK